ncbi:MAG: hypothetical protein JOZ77_10590 [Candidatus Eremiobacteraeota bacterium]|nr:hypothetical protein [Candidatus Eremiobacteraeota bacterium]
MKVLKLGSYALFSCTAAAMLSGCVGSQPPNSLPGTVPQNQMMDTHGDRSVFGKDRTQCPCLYVTNLNHDSVTVYASGATGNVRPIQEISGSKTGLSHPHDVAVDKTGNIYVVNVAPASVTVYPPGATGNVKPEATIRGASTQLEEPTGIAINPGTGDIYVSNIAGGSSMSGSVTIYAAGSSGDVAPLGVIQGSNTRLLHPNCLALDARGNVAVTNVHLAKGYQQGWLTFYAAGSTGNIAPTRVIQGALTKIDLPTQITLDSKQNTYLANYDGDDLTVYDAGANGNVAPIVDIHGRRTKLGSAFGVAIDRAGNIYAASGIAGNSRITVYTSGSDGNVRPVKVIAGSHTSLDFPQGIAVH